MREWVHFDAYREAQVANRPSLLPEQRVVILCSTFWGLRNAVHSGLLKHLKNRGLKISLVVNENGPKPLADACTGAEHTSRLLRAPSVRSERGKPLLDELLNASFARRHQNASYPIFTKWDRRHERGWPRLRSACIELLSRLGRRDLLYQWQINNLDRLLGRTRDYTKLKEQLITLNPALVISTKCTEASEASYIRAAHDLGIATLNWILSFDNLTSRGRLPVSDYYAVWNQRMKDQVLRLYPDRTSSQVYITGTPQFDFHVRPDLHWNREFVLRRLGLRHFDRYLLYAANCSACAPSEPDLIERFASRCAANPDLSKHRIVVRLHPLDADRRWRRFLDRPGKVLISKPWGHDAHSFGIDEQAFLVNTLRHADVCINMASTMSLDAAVLNTPVICVAFATQPGAEDRFCRQVYETEHYRPLIETGGLRLAKDMDQLVAEVTAYVQEPSRDEILRKELVRREVGVVDGLASERIGTLIARLTQDILLRRIHHSTEIIEN